MWENQAVRFLGENTQKEERSLHGQKEHTRSMTAADELSPAGSNTPPISPPRPLSGDRDDLSDMSDSTPSPSALPDQQHPPSFRSSSDYSTTTMNPSSTPLGQLNAARRPGGPISTRPSGLNEDTMAKMKAFSLSRQGAPAPHQNPQMPPHTTSTGDVPTTSSPIPNAKFPGAVAVSQERKPAGNVSLAGGVCGRGLAGANTPGQAPASSPKMGGLAAKRGLKKGMKLSDVAGGPPPSAPGNNNGQASDKEGSSESSAGKDEAGKDAASQGNPTDSLFSKYSEFIDTQAGTLNFKNKAIIHGGGIEFTSGGSFKISLDEVDTLDELGKGNYGTVWKVRHSRPHLRKPGQGLRGIMARRGSISHTGTDGGSHSRSNSPSAGQDLSGAIMAMKEIRLELDESKFTAIIMELDILHRCVSPFIIDFYGAFFQEGAVYICVEYMDGGSIDKLYAGGIPEDILQKVILSTIMGLKSLKDDHNIIHRDVKPTNILVNTRGQIKICDFGVSGNLVASIAKTNIGCQSYMAPERIAGGGMSQSGDASGGTYGVHSDIWSLGLTIIECAIGRYPYPPDTFNNIFSQLNVSSPLGFPSPFSYMPADTIPRPLSTAIHLLYPMKLSRKRLTISSEAA